MKKILLKNATVITMNKNKDIFENTDILVENSKITKISKNLDDNSAKIINAKNKMILPGFVQTHTHLCQTLFRGMAEDRQLLEWLREKIWPYEAAHTPESMYYSSLIGLGELISGGTTTILDMGSTNHTDQIFEAIKNSGIRAFAGKAMMDEGAEIPNKLKENTASSINTSMELFDKWHNTSDGRIKYAFAPRFILSCSDELLKEVAILSEKYNIFVHTHAYENKNEGDEVFELKGKRELEYFEDIGLLNERLLAAHCVWLNDKEQELFQRSNAKVLHCPNSNFKLGSGMLNLKVLLDKGINISIGADGAPCNNNLDMLKELRTTALMQNILKAPGCLQAQKYLEIATIEGAKALGLGDEIGSIEENKKADLVVFDLENDFSTFSANSVDVYTKILYSADRSNIKHVIIDGNIVYEDKIHKTIDKHDTLQKGVNILKSFNL